MPIGFIASPICPDNYRDSGRGLHLKVFCHELHQLSLIFIHLKLNCTNFYFQELVSLKNIL